MKVLRTISLLSLALSYSASSATARVLNVPQKYPTISAALATANPGDTVQVNATTTPYHEAVIIADNNVALIGSGNPVIDGTGLLAPGITILGSGVTVQGFTVQNCHDPTSVVGGPGIYVTNTCLSATISSNTITSSDDGILLLGAGGPTYNHSIGTNTLTNNSRYGLFVLSISGSVVASLNTVTGNGTSGIEGSMSNGITVSSNVISANGAAGAATLGPDAAGVHFSGVGMPGFPGATVAQSYISGNSLSGNYGAGISVSSTTNLTISGNTITSNRFGIGLDSCISMEVANNSINASSDVGFFVQDSNGACTLNSIHDNFVMNGGTDGFHVFEIHMLATGNIFNHNTALGNARYDAVDDSGSNTKNVLNTWTNNTFGKTKPPNLL